MNRFFCVFVLVCSLASCSKNVDTAEKNPPANNDYREYVIPRGQHYAAGNNFRILEKKSIQFKVRFDSSCIYSVSKQENAADINKLYGFSDCGSSHQENSARFGWVWNGKAIELYAYCYATGQRSSKLLGLAEIGKEIELSITAEPGKYIFKLPGKKESMQRSCTGNQAGAYQLFPYFGGDEVAPHDVRIFIKDL